MKHRVARLALLSCLGIACASCGGGGNSVIVVPGDLVASFVPGTPSANPRVSMEDGPAAGDTFTVEIHANGIANLYGVAFTLLYDPALATYLGCEAQGSILSSTPATANACNDTLVGGAKFAAALENNTPGTLNVRASKDGLVAGVSGTGLVLTLSFQALDEVALPGDPFVFEAGPSREVESCAPGNPLPPCTNPAVAWDGGFMTATMM
jgi:hypothetical protein